MSDRLQGKVALVTGASRGIGAAIAKRLAAEGAAVAVGYSSSPAKAEEVVKEIEAAGGKAAAFQADQADAAQVAALVKSVAEKFGRLDVLVNNAGVAVGGSALDAGADPAQFARQWAINVVGVVAAVRAAASILPEGGRIISLGSCLGERIPFPGLSDYGATKAALIGYTKGWARDFGPKGITVNLVEPGPIATDMNPPDGDGSEAQKAQTALGYYGKPEDIAAAVAFLASPEAGYITGAALAVDGGFGA